MKEVRHTKIIKIGNSKGIRIPKKYLEVLGQNVIIEPTKKGLLLRPDQSSVPSRECWETLFANAVASDEKTEKDIFEGMANDSDYNEWEWE